MPRLWTDTIEEHRRTVSDAILEATAALVAEHGLTGVTMSQIAERAGIGRATLYKYFADVEAIMMAWHQRQINAHLSYLGEIAHETTDPADRLRAVLLAYASIMHEHHGHELSAVLHRGDHVARAQSHLRGFIAGLISDGVKSGVIRADVPADELAGFCLSALVGASGLGPKAAVRRLVDVTLAGLSPGR